MAEKLLITVAARMNETERIKSAYARRDAAGKSALYSHFDVAALYTAQQREAAVLAVLKRAGVKGLASLKMLDLGCGTGGVLRDFIRYGAAPENCVGVDLLLDRIEAAKKLSPNIDFRVSNAEALPFGNEEFDLVLCFTVFSSILDPGMKRNVSSEILRVLSRDGFVLWYDYHMDNPSNPDVGGVKKEEIIDLFQGCEINLTRVTLAPPIARAIAPHSVILCRLLEKLPFLRTHYLGVIKKR